METLPPDATQSTNYYSVSADYFKAMGIPLRRGRLFTDRDTKDSARVAVINETMAKKMFPNEDPMGKRITFDQRTQEIGIRMALGAQQGDVLKLIVRQGMSLLVGGVGLGLIGAVALTRVMNALLFGVSAKDPATFASATMLLAAVALLACYFPARRATKVDPLVALRYE